MPSVVALKSVTKVVDSAIPLIPNGFTRIKFNTHFNKIQAMAIKNGVLESLKE